MLEVLGPFPERSLEYMEGLLKEAQAPGAVATTGKNAVRRLSKIGTGTTHLRDVFNTVSGKLNRAEKLAGMDVDLVATKLTGRTKYEIGMVLLQAKPNRVTRR